MTSIATTGTRGVGGGTHSRCCSPVAPLHLCHLLISGHLLGHCPGSQAPVLVFALLSSGSISVPACPSQPSRDVGSPYQGYGFTLPAADSEAALPGGRGPGESCGPCPRVCNGDSGPSGRSVWPLRRTPRCTSAAAKATSATSASPTCRSLGAQKVRGLW